MRRLYILLGMVLLMGGTAAAQEILRIAAVVNDDIISVYDLEARIRLVIVSTGAKDDPRNRQRLAPEVLRALIDERLRLQEAKRHNISVSRREERLALRQLESANRLPEGGLEPFMKRQGIDIMTLKAQIRSSLAWRKYIQRRYQRSIHVSEEEIEEILQRLRANQGQEEFRVSEIFLSVDSAAQETSVRKRAEEIVAQIRKGARFAAVARQFSQNATAAVGGDLGWLSESSLPEQLANVVPKLPLRKVAPPHRSATGYHILYLHERRKSAAADPRRIKVTLARVLLPVALDNRAALAKGRQDMQKLAGEVHGCNNLGGIGNKLVSARASKLGSFVLADLAPVIRDAIKELPIGGASEPVTTDDGLVMFVLCERDQPAFRLPPRTRIRDQLTGRRLERVARRVLRDVRRAAVVDIRI